MNVKSSINETPLHNEYLGRLGIGLAGMNHVKVTRESRTDYRVTETGDGDMEIEVRRGWEVRRRGEERR